MTAQSLTCGTRLSADPTGHRQRNRGDGRDARKTAQITGGEVSGQIKDTGMFPKLPRVDRYPKPRP